jgi:hypothetical protein
MVMMAVTADSRIPRSLAAWASEDGGWRGVCVINALLDLRTIA